MAESNRRRSFAEGVFSPKAYPAEGVDLRIFAEGVDLRPELEIAISFDRRVLRG